MRLDEAWAATIHGGSMSRPSGARIEKWMGDKPDLPDSFTRWIEESIGTVAVADLMAGDWDVDS
jgi:hypothetical protein